MKIGSFTACSNVTGIQTPYYKLAKMMHQHGGICFVDFAASAPYIDINMHPEDPLEKLDAIFFSPHKFLGGPGTSGVLVFDSRIIYKSKFQTIRAEEQLHGQILGENINIIDDIELREDGGTPGILQAIRTALMFEFERSNGG